MSYTEAWDMPVEVRKWWIERKNKDLSDRPKGDNPEAPIPIPDVLKKRPK